MSDSWDLPHGQTQYDPKDLHKTIHHKEPYNAHVTEPETHHKTEPLEAKPEPQKPKIGEIVHYVLDTGPKKGEHRPAIIVRVWSDTCVQLTVFTDWSNDFGHDQHGGGGILWRPSVAIDETDKKPGTFHWSEG